MTDTWNGFQIWRENAVSGEWVYIDEHIDILIRIETFPRGTSLRTGYRWIIWEGSTYRQNGVEHSVDEARYAAWSWYVDWCYYNCPSRLDRLI